LNINCWHSNILGDNFSLAALLQSQDAPLKEKYAKKEIDFSG
jgi:hypothetical protein